jgi:hypothetical protein
MKLVIRERIEKLKNREQLKRRRRHKATAAEQIADPKQAEAVTLAIEVTAVRSHLHLQLPDRQPFITVDEALRDLAPFRSIQSRQSLRWSVSRP